MNRKLPWACGILVVIVLAVRGPWQTSSPAGATKVAPVRTEASAPPEPKPVRENEILAAYRRGEDPLIGLARTPEEKAERQERQVRVRGETDRLRARQVQVTAQQERFFEEHRARLIQAGFDPDLPDPRR